MMSDWFQCRHVWNLGILLGGLICCSGPRGMAADNAAKQSRPALEGLLKRLGFGVVPLKRGEENQLYLDAQLGGKKRHFIVDTGCQLTTLDTSVARKLKSLHELGARLADPILGQFDDSSLVLMDALQLGTIRLTNQPARVQSLHPTSDDGILGCDFLLRHACLIDCADGRLYLRGQDLKADARDILERSLAQSGYHGAPLEIKGELVITCAASINSVPVKLLVDTGSSFTILDDKPAVRCGLRWEETGRQIRGVSKIGSTKILGAKPKSFKIGDVEMPLRGLVVGGAEMAEWQIGEEDTALKDVDGVLGADVLAVSGALIDLPGRKLWFVPASVADKSSPPASKTK